ncbi:ArsR/SmtB family transcription factor [Phragmitibacter flavus]|nr:metalloregulator ArsR/SmtB family transcription factor [Phragmitibacter flavus]
MKRQVAVAHALGDETRWRIAALMAQEALCVCELVDILDLAQSTVSSHLQVMRKAEMVTMEKADKWVYYQLSREVLPVWKAMRGLDDEKVDRVLERDAKRAVARLALRGQSECKGPRKSIPPVHKVAKRACVGC